MRELALFIVPTYVLAVTTVLSNLLYSHGNKDTLDELFFGEGTREIHFLFMQDFT